VDFKAFPVSKFASIWIVEIFNYGMD